MPPGPRPTSTSRITKANIRAAGSILPQQIQQTVPSCAQSCLESFIGAEYASCSEDDLSCLCSQYSSQGFTLGELAYGCSYLYCPDAPRQQYTELYNICSARPNAVQATHTRITLPTVAATVYTDSTTTVVQSATSGPATQTSSLSTTQSVAEPTMSPGSSSSTMFPSPTSTNTASGMPSSSQTSSPAAAYGSTTLTSAQAAGASIGALAALLLAIALAYTIIWCRRRRALRSPRSCRHSYDFIDDATPRFSPFHHGYANSGGQIRGFAKPKAELWNEKTQHEWYGRQDRTLKPHDRRDQYGTPKLQSSPPRSKNISIESIRTLSQLLPDKPGQTPPQPVYRSPRPRPISAWTTPTVFEDMGTPRILSPALMVPLPANPRPVLKTVPPKRPARPDYVPQYTRSPDEIRQPNLSLDIPRKAASTERIPSPVQFLPPPLVAKDSPALAKARSSTGSRIRSTHSSQPPDSGKSYLPDYYTHGESHTPTFDMITPIEDEAQRRRPIPASIVVTKPTYPPRAVRASTGSDTSFESTDPEEVTPEEEDKQLSPVAESPVSKIRYPKVPRSSNQAIPRSPKPTLSPQYGAMWPLTEVDETQLARKRHSRTDPVTPKRTPTNASLSGTTLAAKRRGDGAAHDLELGLHIQDSSHSRSNSRTASTTPPSRVGKKLSTRAARHESPLKGYGRVTSGGRRLSHDQVPSYSRKPSYSGNDWGEMPMTPPEMMSPGPKLLRLDQNAVLKSPLWEPKLTPSRRGDDLYLDVSMASPGMGGMPLTPSPVMMRR